MLKTGLVSVTFRDKTPEEIISAVKQCGLEGIEWGGDVHVLPGDVSRAREIRHLTEQAGLAVWAYGSYFEAGEQTPDLFPPVLESAKALGAPCIRIWAGTRGSAQADPEYVQRVISCTQAICDMASTAGIDICYEYHPNTLTDNCDSAAQTLRSVARDNLHLYWQPNSRLSQAENLHALRPAISVSCPCILSGQRLQPFPTGRRRNHMAGISRYHPAGRQNAQSDAGIREGRLI